MSLFKAAGIAFELPEGEQETAMNVAMLEVAELFIRSGGRWEWRDFIGMTHREMAICAEAGDRVFADRASASGLAAQSHMGSAVVRAGYDGGEDMTRLVVKQKAIEVTERGDG